MGCDDDSFSVVDDDSIDELRSCLSNGGGAGNFWEAAEITFGAIEPAMGDLVDGGEKWGSPASSPCLSGGGGVVDLTVMIFRKSQDLCLLLSVPFGFG